MAHQSGQPSTGLPPGVEVGDLGRRLVAHLIDSVVPVVAVVVGQAVAATTTGPVRALAVILAGLVVLAWALLVWWMFAVRAAGPGMRLMKLQLVGFSDGRPIGWGRFAVRWLVWLGLSLTLIGLLVMLVFLVRHPRKQGWHDLAANAVVIKERTLAPASRRPAPATAAAAAPAAQLRPQSVSVVQGSAGPGTAEPEPQAAPPTREPEPARVAMVSAAAAERNEMPLAPEDGRPLDEGWYVVLDDGRELTVDSIVLLGRNPQGRVGEEDAQLIKIADETRTVSKSHLAIGVDRNGIYVMDRGSTNGSTVTTVTGVSVPCAPGDLVSVAEGAIVSFGDHWLEVRRRPIDEQS